MNLKCHVLTFYILEFREGKSVILDSLIDFRVVFLNDVVGLKRHPAESEKGDDNKEHFDYLKKRKRV